MNRHIGHMHRNRSRMQQPAHENINVTIKKLKKRVEELEIKTDNFKDQKTDMKLSGCIGTTGATGCIGPRGPIYNTMTDIKSDIKILGCTGTTGGIGPLATVMKGPKGNTGNTGLEENQVQKA